MRRIKLTASSVRMVIMVLCITVVALVPTIASAGTKQAPVSVRATIVDNQFSRVALVDQKTPTPDTTGKDMLFIDGKYLSAASNDVVENVKSLLTKGMPVVVFGDGYQALRDRVPNLPYSDSY